MAQCLLLPILHGQAVGGGQFGLVALRMGIARAGEQLHALAGVGLFDREQKTPARQVVLKLKTPWRDGTPHLIRSPLDFMQRLAAPVWSRLQTRR